MKKPGLADRIAFASLVVGQGVKRLRRGLAAPLRLASVWRASAPERLVIAPQDLRTADPTIADDIYGGYFVFHGKAVNTHGESPFLIEPPSAAWSEALLGFGWLRHLRAADTMLARANARALVLDWMTIHGAPPGGDPSGRQALEAGWSADVVARRVLAWISHSPLILDGADRAFYRRFMKSLARQCAWLSRALAGGLEGDARLFAAVALTEFAICADAPPGRRRRRALKALEKEIATQILPDGGHVSRNPRMVVDALLILLPLRQAFAASGAQTPQSLITAIDRMLPMLRMLRHEDGALALFNGMGATRADLLATLLAYEDSAEGALGHAPQSGYLSLSEGDVRLVADIGAAPPRAFSCEAHAGALSFELTSGAQRIVVNCGAPERGRGALREAARQTAAHSTLTLADTSSVRFAPTSALSQWLDGQIIAGPRKVEIERLPDGAVAATHDGYLARFGLRHRRVFRLTRDALHVEDRLIPDPRVGPAEAPPFALRLHLHPTSRCAATPSAEGVLIEPPSGEAWAFHCEGEQAAIEESAFFATHEGPRPSSQIVVERPAGPFAPLLWRLERLQR